MLKAGTKLLPPVTLHEGRLGLGPDSSSCPSSPSHSSPSSTTKDGRALPPSSSWGSWPQTCLSHMHTTIKRSKSPPVIAAKTFQAHSSTSLSNVELAKVLKLFSDTSLVLCA